MSPARIGAGQAGEGLEALEEAFGQGREARAIANVVEARHDQMTRPIDGRPIAVVEDAAGLEVLDMPQELLAEEVRKGLPFLGIHRASGKDVA